MKLIKKSPPHAGDAMKNPQWQPGRDAQKQFDDEILKILDSGGSIRDLLG
jgi:hypothetical protein